MHLLRAPIIHASEAIPITYRPIHRHRLHSQHRLHLIQQRQRVQRRPIQLIDEREHRNSALATHLKQLARLRFHTLGCIQNHHRTVGGHQRPVGIFRKILMAGRIQQIDHVALIGKLQHRRGDGNAAFLLHRHPIRGGAALIAARPHTAGQVDGVAVKQQFFGQRGFAGVWMRNNGERTPGINGLLKVHVEGNLLFRHNYVSQKSFPPPAILGDDRPQGVKKGHGNGCRDRLGPWCRDKI